MFVILNLPTLYRLVWRRLHTHLGGILSGLKIYKGKKNHMSMKSTIVSAECEFLQGALQIELSHVKSYNWLIHSYRLARQINSR